MLRHVCRLARREDAQLSVALIHETRPIASGCCGISATHWRAILDGVDRDDALRAERIASMHELMGRRYAGCASGAGAAGTPMGPGMVGGDWGSGMMGDGWGPMMDSEDWSWMAGGGWRTMDRQDWQAMQDRWMDPGMMCAGSGWSAWEVAGVVLAGLLAAPLLVVLLTQRPRRRRPVSAH